jgi:hypothetical protein
MTSLFCAQQQITGTVADKVIQTQKPCRERENAPKPDVGADRHDRTLPHCGDDEAFADRLQRAWQKMLDDDLDYFQVQGDLDRERTA